ncbi:MAG: hypothetical protein ABI693_26075 [Bryobacteraceae bacterium]
MDAYGHFIAAADKVGVTEHARNDMLAIATKAKQNGASFNDILIGCCSPDLQVYAVRGTARVAKQRTWTKRRTRR